MSELYLIILLALGMELISINKRELYIELFVKIK